MKKTLDFKPKFFSAIKNYDRKTFVADLMEKGIITAIVAGLFISLFGGSKVQIGGPTGAFIVIVYGIIQQYGIQGLTIATLMAGVFLIMLGVLRLGTIIKYIPYPIVVGFTSGIAVTIFTTQVKDLLGHCGRFHQWYCRHHLHHTGERPAGYVDRRSHSQRLHCEMGRIPI